MKRLMILVLSILLLVGCAPRGVDIDKHNAVVEERDALQRQINDLTSEIQVLVANASATPEPTEPTVPTETIAANANNAAFVVSIDITLSFDFGKRSGVYTGELLDGLPHGYGIFESQSVSGEPWIYEGNWERGHFSGIGYTLFFIGNYWQKKSGNYENDYLIDGTTITLEVSQIYEGEIGRDGKSHGYGKLLNPNGETIFEGMFINGEPAGTNMADASTAVTTNSTPRESSSQTVGPTFKPATQTTEASSTALPASPSPSPSTTASSITAGQQNALKKAKEYLSVVPFSRKGLVEQLEYDKYTHEEAVYGVENCGANWSEQATKKAKAYLAIMPFSRDGLIDQLKFDGFTSEQASYGVAQNGL